MNVVGTQVNVKPRSPSVEVSSRWEIKAEIDFLQLSKLHFTPEEPKQLLVIFATDVRALLLINANALCYSRRVCGSLGFYDATKEKKISLKLPQPLQVFDRIFHKVTTTDDPIIREVGCKIICLYLITVVWWPLMQSEWTVWSLVLSITVACQHADNLASYQSQYNSMYPPPLDILCWAVSVGHCSSVRYTLYIVAQSFCGTIVLWNSWLNSRSRICMHVHTMYAFLLHVITKI